MIDTIKNVVILGASGTIGSLTGGIIAQQGIKVFFLSRKLDHAKAGLKRAMSQARSHERTNEFKKRLPSYLNTVICLSNMDTALEKLAQLRRRIKRFTKLKDTLKKLSSPNLEKALTFLDDSLLPATSNAVERGKPPLS